jgi:hypothetical protein
LKAARTEQLKNVAFFVCVRLVVVVNSCALNMK